MLTLVSAAAELPFDSPASSMAEATLLVTDSVSMDVSLLEGLSLVREGREGIVSMLIGVLPNMTEEEFPADV